MIRWMLGWILDGSWIDFLLILGPSWEVSWGQVGTKMVPKWGSGRLVRHKGGQEAILDRDADRDAHS